MISRTACQSALCRRPCVRSSYAEISRFLRTRRHETTSDCQPCSRIRVRHFSSTKTCRQIELSEALRKTLDSYKASIHSGFAYIPNNLKPKLKESIGKETSLIGYLSSRRNVSKKLTFALLRSPTQSYCVQLVSANQDSGAHNTLRSLKEWTPVLVRGTVKERAHPAEEDTVSGMKLINDTELDVHAVEPLNEIPSELLLKDDTVFSPEQRHLQLRTNDKSRHSLLFRSKLTNFARLYLDNDSFEEIETPLLFKSTPEGAREFLVPTRAKGMAYALPQSPQQYKQMLMASGICRYYQFARCFRDEDLRADRQPEFTQLDLEMAFQAEDDVMKQVETLLIHLWAKGLKYNLNKRQFGRMTYQEAMATYGSDKPDLRLGMKIHSITERLPPDLISKITPLQNPAVDAFKFSISSDPQATRKFISDFLDSPEGKPFLDNPNGQPGVFVADASQPLNGLGALGYGFVMECPEELSVDHGELLVIQARKNAPFSGGSTPLGNLRLALHKAAVAQGFIEQSKGFKFVWITDFPLFSPTNNTDPGQGGAAGLSSTHHPFTAPKTAEDVELLLTAPEKAVAAHYDIVVNGIELGGGSRRIHNAEVQEFIFRDVLKMTNERIEDFRHLLDVLRSGCPPHAGIALGWDRLIAVMLNKESVRDVIAFPKSGKGEDILVKSPNMLSKEQLATYHLQLKD